jgi:hypothetical protein
MSRAPGRGRGLTEADWLGARAVTAPLMNWLRGRGSERQFYLAAAAFARQVEPRMTDERCRALIPLVERFADGLAPVAELARAHRRLEAALFDQWTALQRDGLTPAQANKRQAADVTAVRAAAPEGGWMAAINAVKQAEGAGKRAEMGPRQVAVLHDIFGNPFRPVAVRAAWRTPTVVRLATAIYDEAAFDRLPILGDALEDSGCADLHVLRHCRDPGQHWRGCWVVDQVLAKG